MCLLMQSDLPLWQKYDLLLVEKGTFLPLPKVDGERLKAFPGHNLGDKLVPCLAGQTRHFIME